MGSTLSRSADLVEPSGNVTSESEAMNANSFLEIHTDSNEEFHDAAEEDDAWAKAKEEEMNEFKKQLIVKRQQRKEILTRHRTEKEALEKALLEERTSKNKLYANNEQLRELLRRCNIEIPENLNSSIDTSEFAGTIHEMREGFEKLKSDNNKLRRDLAEANSSLQSAYSDIADLSGQSTESIKQISALKDVVAVSKTMISLREGQLNELKNKLDEIERSLADRESNILSAELRQEYERQLQNIRSLRALYEERARIGEITRQGLVRDLEQHKVLLQAEIQKSKELADKVEALEEKVEKLEDIIENKNIEISTCREETSRTKAEMTVVNKLFSQVLLGYKTKQDLDKLVHRLEENHGLLTHMAGNENDLEASSALPKLLLELVSEVDEIDNEKSENEDEFEIKADVVLPSENIPNASTAEEIVENLPKVWRVLMELLSHQATVEDSAEKISSCYKLVETNSGPVEVPSVSQTYIRLKDLIVEKLGLVKEVNRMKQLNSHLENRLQEQEKRLCLVTTELGKTWHVVGKLRRHHYQLHTHEKILKYELQQKRKLLNELKEELEYCREKWDEAREKNNQSERDWKILRNEFTSRKTKSGSPSFNNSGESGYSDERPSDESSESNDESEYVAEPPVRCKKKMKKSFETILDSSTDFNCAAEREDPASDMLDVADLPLDTHDVDNHGVVTSECSISDNLLKCKKTCETEDEICEIAHDDSTAEKRAQIVINNNDDTKTSQETRKTIASDTNSHTFQPEPNTSTSNKQAVKPPTPAEILINIRKQNERLTKRDERLQNLEDNTIMVLNKSKATSEISENINNTLDRLLSRPTSSTCKQNTESKAEMGVDTQTSLSSGNVFLLANPTNLVVDQSNEGNSTASKDELITKENAKTIDGNYKNELIIKSEHQTINDSVASVTIATDPDIQLTETVTQQGKPLADLDKEIIVNNSQSSGIVSDNGIPSALGSYQDLVVEQKTVYDHKKYNELSKVNATSDWELNDNKEPEPSTSSEADHEARFAARDIRLKRLEEQTKSLVTKMNKTNSKGVKIHYKLQELHNIYGSENSRAGTPDENSDRSIDEDNIQNEKSNDEDPDTKGE